MRNWLQVADTLPSGDIPQHLYDSDTRKSIRHPAPLPAGSGGDSARSTAAPRPVVRRSAVHTSTIALHL